MAFPVATSNNVKIYTVSGSNLSRAIPDWLAKKRRKSLKNDLEWRHRVELIHDFDFPEASLRIKNTPDGNFCLATGVYKPQIRVYDYAEMSMKFERHTDAENVNFVLLSDDWTKSVHLQNDRSIEFHAQGGIHYKTRIPKFGRDLAYHFPSCDLFLAASGSEVYRLNLSRGQFMTPVASDSVDGVNCISINPAHQLITMGTMDGTIEFVDPRSRDIIARASVRSLNGNDGAQVTAIANRDDGLGLAVGTSEGKVLLWDLRERAPWLVKDHYYDLPIKRVLWHQSKGDGDTIERVISVDSKVVRIWNPETGNVFASVEAPADINDVCAVPGSGLIYVANEGIQIQTYYLPSLGPAPRWCAFLDNLTEELEENPREQVYDDYRFVTRKELESLGLDHLIGTNLLKASMHGFFMDHRLYERARLIAEPFAYEEYRKKMIQEKLEKKREARIRVRSTLPKVNKEFAQSLISRIENVEETKRGKKNIAAASSVLKDERFATMFEDPEYQVDAKSNEFKLLHPTLNTSVATPNQSSYRVIESDVSDVSDYGEDDAEDEDGVKDLQVQEFLKEGAKKAAISSDSNSSSSEDEGGRRVQSKRKFSKPFRMTKNKKRPQLPPSSSGATKAVAKQTFGERLQQRSSPAVTQKTPNKTFKKRFTPRNARPSTR